MGDRAEEETARPPEGAGERVETVYADLALCVDMGETVRCLLLIDEPGGPRRRRQWVVFPRSGFLTSLVAATEQFLEAGPKSAADPGSGGPPGRGPGSGSGAGLH